MAKLILLLGLIIVFAFVANNMEDEVATSN